MIYAVIALVGCYFLIGVAFVLLMMRCEIERSNEITPWPMWVFFGIFWLPFVVAAIVKEIKWIVSKRKDTK